MSIDAHKYMTAKRGEMTLARAVRAARLSEEMSQAELGQKIGATRGYICNVESGRTAVELAQAMRLAKALGLSPEYFASLMISDMLRKHKLVFNGEVRAA